MSTDLTDSELTQFDSPPPPPMTAWTIESQRLQCEVERDVYRRSPPHAHVSVDPSLVRALEIAENEYSSLRASYDAKYGRPPRVDDELAARERFIESYFRACSTAAGPPLDRSDVHRMITGALPAARQRAIEARDRREILHEDEPLVAALAIPPFDIQSAFAEAEERFDISLGELAAVFL
jgi:hypothetical protein